MSFLFLRFYEDPELEEEYQKMRREENAQKMPSQFRLLVFFLGIWSLVGSFDWNHFVFHIFPLYSSQTWAMCCTGLAIVYLLLFQFQRRFMQAHLFTMVSIFLLLNNIHMSFLVRFSSATRPMPEMDMKNSIIYGVGLALGGTAVSLPVCIVAAVKPPPEHSLLALTTWSLGVGYGAYPAFAPALDHNSTRPGDSNGAPHSIWMTYYFGWLIVVLTTASLCFVGTRSDELLRRMNFNQQQQLQAEQVDIIADIDDPFRVSNIKRWLQRSSAVGMQESAAGTWATGATAGTEGVGAGSRRRRRLRDAAAGGDYYDVSSDDGSADEGGGGRRARRVDDLDLGQGATRSSQDSYIPSSSATPLEDMPRSSFTPRSSQYEEGLGGGGELGGGGARGARGGRAGVGARVRA